MSGGEPKKIGTWTFDPTAGRQYWTSVLNRYNYALPCPWQTPPAGPNVHIDVTFVDELTQARFKKSADVTVEVPASGGPATRP
jgi:hypothetical protein